MTDFFAKMLDWEVLHSLGVDRWGTRPTLFSGQEDNVGNVLTPFQFIKQMYMHIELD